MRNGDELICRNGKDQYTKRAGWKAYFNITHRIHMVAFIPGVTLSFGAGVLEPVMAVFLGKYFDAFADYGAGKTASDELTHRTLISVYAIIGVGTATILLKGGMFTAWLIFGEMQAKSVRDELFQRLLKKDLGWFEMKTDGITTLLTRVQTQVRELQIGTSQPMGFSINCIVEGLTALGLSFYYSWKLTLVILASVPVSAIILGFISSGIQPNIIKQSEALSNATKAANNIITNIVIIKCCNNQDTEFRQYIKHIQIAATFYLKQALVIATQMGFVKFASIAMFVQGFWYGGTLVHGGQMTAGEVITTFWSCLMAVQAFEDILPHLLILAKGRAASVSLRSLLNTVQEGQEVVHKTNGLSPQFCEGEIEVRNVSFAYPSRSDHLVLDESSFSFPAGETTFVVGRSGSGKSTLGNLLTRFYQPRSGCVFVDGKAITDLDAYWLRNNITFVQQQSMLFNETIFRNIAFGHPHFDQVTHSQIRPCVELAALNETIRGFPNGLETIVGNGGSALSGGQKQRIAIARARLRDTPILILDEATSALDYLSKTSVMKAIREWRNGKTTIIITHDLNQIGSDDFVYVLEDGRVATEGYWRNIAQDLEAGIVQSSLMNPTISNSYHFDFGFTAELKNAFRTSFARNQRSAPLRKLLQQERDSIEPLLKPIGEGDCQKPSNLIGRNRHLSRRVSKRLAAAAESAIDGLILRSDPRVNRTYSNKPDHVDHNFRFSMNQAVALRPMSMHKAVVLPSIYIDYTTEKEISIPGTSKGLEDLRKPFGQKAAEVHSPYKQLSVLPILATAWPDLGKRGYSKLFGGSFALLIVAGISPVFAYLLVQLFQTFYIPTEYKVKTLRYSLGLVGVAVVDGIATFTMKYLFESVGQIWIDNLRTEAVRRITEQPKSWFDDANNNSGYLVSALDRNAEEMRNLLARFAGMIVVVILMMAISTVWAMVLCWKVTLVAIAAGPVLYFLTKVFDTVSTRWEGRTNTASDILNAVFIETFSGIRTLRSLTLESYFHRKYTLATSKAFSIGIQRAVFSGLFFGLSDAAVNYITALIFWFATYLATSQSYSTSIILQAVSLILFSTASANGIIANIPQLASCVDTASRLIHLARLPLRSHEYTGRFRLPLSAVDALSEPISFINLTFYYPARLETPALRHLNLNIPSGQCTAIVGSSGSGKSTIASLLLGLYPPTSDSTVYAVSDIMNGPPSLTIFGHDIRSLHLPTLRNIIGIVPQTPVLFPCSARENITYGLALNSSLTTPENIEKAARQAGIHDFIMSLPQKYDTVLGEGGLGVSGGQAQRIVIARALVRQPRILILDEVTSALDQESARTIQRSISELIRESKATDGISGGARQSPKLTVIVITHAKEMMSFADKVVVMENGSVAEEGGFDELIRRKAKLWEMLRIGGVV